ncbi:CNH domain-containing protein [Mycena alexandri]|uniref:CNH domain-containing protein n=1 Tax=Mycena alexandri TaxID=1745969 RepID=A0AAD6S6I7_9AGAR|nr:CNH domain-containing protein [Mycena alexandri]
MPFPFISSSSRGKDSSEDIRSRSKWNFLRNVGNSPSSSAGGGSHRRRPFPTAITDQVSTEIYELIIDQLSADKASLLACNLVCRSWGPRSKMLLMSLMICRPAPLVGHNHHEFGEIACAVPNPASDGEIIYGTPGGIYRTFKDGSTPRFFDIRDVSQMEVLPDVNLFLGLSGGDFFTWPLSTLQAGSYHWDSDITRLSKHVSFFNVYRSTNPGENHRVNFTSPRETYSIHFLSRTRLAAALKKGFAVQGGFEMVDLVTSETQDLLDLSDPSLQFASKKVKAMGVFWVSSTFLVCYDKFAFYVDRIGRMSLYDRVMRWTGSASAFALHGPYILTFCTNHVEIWNIETGKLEQKLSGFYHLLNAPDSGEKVLVLSVSCDIAEMIFRDSAV